MTTQTNTAACQDTDWRDIVSTRDDEASRSIRNFAGARLRVIDDGYWRSTELFTGRMLAEGCEETMEAAKAAATLSRAGFELCNMDRERA